MFLKNKNIIFKIRRSKVTDYAALNERILYRLEQVGLVPMRPSALIGRYKMISHDQREMIPLQTRFLLSHRIDGNRKL